MHSAHIALSSSHNDDDDVRTLTVAAYLVRIYESFVISAGISLETVNVTASHNELKRNYRVSLMMSIPKKKTRHESQTKQ